MKLLLVEDDHAFAQLIAGFLKKNNYEVEVFHNIRKAKEALSAADADIALFDFNLPDGTALELLQHMSQTGSYIPAVIMTSFHDIRTAVKAMQMGARNYILKPLNNEELLMVLRDVAEPATGKSQPINPDSKKGALPSFVKGVSEDALTLQRHIELVAPTNMSVIILGESGTGKEHLARSIHENSQRSGGPFRAIDCGALSDELAGSELFGHIKGAFTGAVNDKKGEFEAAQGGTLFLDEVGNLSYQIQVKLLRAIQERVIQRLGSTKLVKVDVRLIAATNEDLNRNVTVGSFRQDLFHRLNEFSIQVPPLRERKEDLKEFVTFFISQACTELERPLKSVSPEVMKVFEAYHWPGNLRELKNIIKRAVLLCAGDVLTHDTLPTEMFSSKKDPQPLENLDLKQMNEQNEKKLIIKTLQDVKYNKSKAASVLNIDRKTLYLKMARYGIEG